MTLETQQQQGLPPVIANYQQRDRFCVPLMEKPPSMDGRLWEEEWTRAAAFDGMSYGGQLEERRVRTYVGATKTHFYFAILSEMPEGGELAAKTTKHGSNIVFDDAIEVYIVPEPGVEAGFTYQAYANPAGVDGYEVHEHGGASLEDVYGWKGKYRFANGFHDGYWHSIIEVPIANIVQERSATDGEWGISLCRDWKNPWNFSALNGMYTLIDQVVFKFVEEGGAAVQPQAAQRPLHARCGCAALDFQPGTRAIELFGAPFPAAQPDAGIV